MYYYLDHWLDACLGVKKRMDYSVLSKDEIREELECMGERGAFTIVDWYLNTDYKLYEQLIHYPEDSLTKKRTMLYDYIATTFDGCLDISTGGWC